MKMRVRSLDPMSVGKTMAAIYGAMSLLFVPIFAMMVVVGSITGGNQKNVPFAGMFGAGLGLALMIIVPVLYAFLGFIAGALMALVYNLVSRWTGGLVMELLPAHLDLASIPSEPPYPLVPPTQGVSNV